jgi:hypothetical protein
MNERRRREARRWGYEGRWRVTKWRRSAIGGEVQRYLQQRWMCASLNLASPWAHESTLNRAECDYAVNGCSVLALVSIPDVLIGTVTFTSCTRLRMWGVPVLVRESGNRAFEGSRALADAGSESFVPERGSAKTERKITL